jgi:uncharacterized membrane protein (UPF0182 family)
MGTKVIRGNLLVIPVEDSLVYVEPLYLRSDQGQIPELKRVIVAYNDRVAMEPTLEAALSAVFKPGAAPPRVIERPATAAPSETAAAETARAHYRAALDALRAGDWSGFGREMEARQSARRVSRLADERRCREQTTLRAAEWHAEGEAELAVR